VTRFPPGRLGVLAVVALAAPALRAQSPMLYDNLGGHHRPITTGVPRAQQFFDQGLRLLYAFNHAEAIRGFEEAERLDPACAMCAWGIALALGPNLNAAMEPGAAAAAWKAVKRALGRAAAASPVEQAVIGALAARYAERPPADRAPLDSAYARAMAEAARAFPDDGDVRVLAADALMNLSPWNYWEPDGKPRPETPRILSLLEGALAGAPDHPGACHLFIHAVEAREPARAVACAERLAALMPGAGHLVHMPAHIYIRVGRYADAIEANRHAVHADEAYLEGPAVRQRAGGGGVYASSYYPHNYHFLSFAAAMAGRAGTAIDAARKAAARLSADLVREVAWLEAVTPILYWTLVTFGRWDAILSEPLPPASHRFAYGQAYYARGVAFAAKGRWAEAAVALDTVRVLAAAFPEGDNRTALRIAAEALAGEIHLRRGEAGPAVSRFERARELEDGMAYTEPPTWYYPIRHSLGKALLAAGRPAEAERRYREDLERFPENGWSLLGLAQSLERQRRSEEAAAVRARFAAAWREADARLKGSRF
jgi:tetratricopeptide (TPR) repeat protein